MRGSTNTHKQVPTFPGGDESGQELAEVGAGLGVVQRKAFQLGGRASVLVVGLLHRLDVRLQKSCPAEERGMDSKRRRRKRKRKRRMG